VKERKKDIRKKERKKERNYIKSGHEANR